MKKRKVGERGRRKAPYAAGPDVWDLRPWCEAFGISRSLWYTLDENLKPHHVKLGKLVKIHESPGAYARRIAEQQAPA